MDLDQLVMKTEIHPNGDILLYYVDDNQQVVESAAGIVENEQQEDIQMISETKYVIEDTGESESADELDLAQASEQFASEQWTDEEIRRLIIFYIDNKETFQSGTAKKKHLWAVACKTMLLGKQPLSCEYKLREFREKYFLINSDKLEQVIIQRPFYNLCHKAFQDENPIDMYLNVSNKDSESIKKETPIKKSMDTSVEKMLNLYLKYKNIYANNINTKTIWERIARDMNEKDVDYWYKRFLNYKQHYIKMLHKRIYSGDDGIHWPYMRHFDQIFANDEEFQKKFAIVENTPTEKTMEWNETEKTFLCKYYFDCLHEFHDPTIPNDFLWHDVGRLLEKPAENCNEKFNSVKNEHFEKLLEGDYNLSERLTWEIIMDNIIYKETLKDLENNSEVLEDWDMELLDILVQFVYDNINLVKDPVCYYVCLSVITIKLNCGVVSCKNQWDNLVDVYKSILNDKKENPEIQIDWRYIDMFDVIFDYGMDVHLLDGYKKEKVEKKQNLPAKLEVKKINMKDLEDNYFENIDNDDIRFDERGFTTRVKRDIGRAKGIKILEYYLKNKDKFNSPNYKKAALWEILSKEIGISATECAHRFRNFKQIYLNHVQREITKPELPIVWPYFTICKKVFGYRAVKAKLKSHNILNDTEDWSHQDITKLINFATANFDDGNEEKWRWEEIANITGHTAMACLDKYFELRKCYRKLKTMKSNNPEKRVSWKYFDVMDKIYTRDMVADIKMEVQDDDDFQCLIVIPEGQDISQAQIIYPNEDKAIKSESKSNIIWNRQSKTKLLNLYLKYLISHDEIIPKQMWKEISLEMDGKSAISCKKMYILLKNRYRKNEMKYKQIFTKIIPRENKPKAVDLSDEKIEAALVFYLKNIEDFLNPQLQDLMWSELAGLISEPADVINKKLNHLFTTGTPFEDLLKEISEKEKLFKIDASEVSVWTDTETERLLTWYLAHLDKFKNPECVRSYLWMEAADILKKSPLDCSNKMMNIRAQYRMMFKENPEKLQKWDFYNLCQRIYGTGKKSDNEL
ncbi:unnamed protein product [Pieris macdunnoughi]|uniref:Myb/SANT-like DNA-binding domain-containing protein n=1 Tax=Pieris macdunnoughi TaxID=345717 RepID=A0A821UW56_9NEOP|nr:unnamed protein product [Pieris macdunnoughi]